MPNINQLLVDIIRFVVEHSERESCFLTPDPQWYMSNPHGLFKLIEESGFMTAEEIDDITKGV